MKYLTDSAVICTWSRLWLQAICLGVGPVRLRLSLYFFQAWQEDVWANNRAGETLFTHRYTFSISIYAHLSVSPAVGLHALHSFVCICRPPVVSIPLFLSVSLCEYSLCRLLKGDSLFSTLSRPTWKWPARFKRRLNKFSVVCWHFKYQASAEPSLPCPSGGNLRCGSFTSHAWCMAAYLFAALLPVMSYISLPHDLSLPEVMSAVGDTTRLFLGENNEQLC